MCTAQADSEWGGAGAAARDWGGRPEGVPRSEKYDTKPYEPEDDDEYRPDAPQEAAAAQPQQGGVRGCPTRACLSWESGCSDMERLQAGGARRQ